MPPSSSPGSGTFALRAPTSAPGAWSVGRPFNAGLATRPAGLLVVDCDTRTDPDDLTAGPPEEWEGATGGVDVLALLAERAGATLPATFTVTTPSGGTHFYYRAPSGVELRNTAGLLGWKIDTRAHGGYVVAPGSTTSASAYTVTDGRPVAELPAWLAGWLAVAASAPGTTIAVRAGSGRRHRYLDAALRAEQRGPTRRRPRVVDALGHRKP
jgi:hypothetical protein